MSFTLKFVFLIHIKFELEINMSYAILQQIVCFNLYYISTKLIKIFKLFSYILIMLKHNYKPCEKNCQGSDQITYVIHICIR